MIAAPVASLGSGGALAPVDPVASGSPAASFGLIDQLLRDRDAMLARISAGQDLAAITRTMVATIAIAMAIVGAALGSYRGGVQIGFAAIKLPLVLLGTAALSAPALTAIGAALGRRARERRDQLCGAGILLVAMAAEHERCGEWPQHRQEHHVTCRDPPAKHERTDRDHHADSGVAEAEEAERHD